MRSCPVKENHISSAVSEILWYKRQTNIPLLYHKDIMFTLATDLRPEGPGFLSTSPAKKYLYENSIIKIRRYSPQTAYGPQINFWRKGSENPSGLYSM